MSFLRNVGTDLVEKRLWPVAALLVVALVAVPLLLGRGQAEPTAASVPVATPDDGSTVQPVVAVQVTTQGKTFRAGATRDPFTRKGAAASSSTSTATATTATAGTTTTATATTGTTGTTTTPSSGSTTSGSDTGGDDASTPAPSGATSGSRDGDPTTSYAVTTRFGVASASLSEREDVARLTALPSAKSPLFVYLGVVTGGDRAVFLLVGDVDAGGDAICKPTPLDCRAIELEQGDTAKLAVTRDGVTTQYRLGVHDIDPIDDRDSRSVAIAAIERHSEAGAELLRDAHISRDRDFAGMERYRWMASIGGSLSRVTNAQLLETSSSAELQGEPVWHHEYAG